MIKISIPWSRFITACFMIRKLTTCFKTRFRRSEDDYHKWQLLSNPISLREFNKQSHLSSEFFTLGCHLVTQIQSHVETEHYYEIAILAHEV